MDKKLESKSKYTIRQYSIYLRKFETPKPVADVDRSDIRNFLGSIELPYARHAAFRTLRVFFNWCESERYLTQNPIARMKAPELPKKLIEIYTDDEIRSMINSQSRDSFIGNRNKAIIWMLYDTGIRLNELITLKLNNVNIEDGLLKVLGKGNKERTVPFGKNAAKALWHYLRLRKDNYQEAWLSEEKRPLEARGVEIFFHRTGEALKLGKRCSPHTFRHTWAVNMLRNGCNIRDLQILGGWSSLDMVMRYTKALSTEDAIKAHQRFSPGDRLR
ncbi:MAG: tyrosine-type recombinase/integrase [Dehalococcoidia bacterium]|nr:tyrosine-type recombinase/integrase [Dehalococcoidia bacterium]